MMLSAVLAMAIQISSKTQDWLVCEPANPNGKHIILLAGDEEYRSEEALPQLAKILSQRQGFRCTVLFSMNAKGEIDPNKNDHQPGLHLLDTADLCIMALRFRKWPVAEMKFFDAYVNSKKPIIALRTSTHAFDISDGPFEKYGWQSKTWTGGFGKQILGETWVSHWGEHGTQATRGVRVASHPILSGVDRVFGTTDVYEANPPSDALILMRGEVLNGMLISSPPATAKRKNSLGVERDVNDPMMPILWTREVGGRNVVTCTMGAATDFLDANLRRIVVNACFWSLGLNVPTSVDVSLVGEYKPSPYGFGGFKKGVRPRDLLN